MTRDALHVLQVNALDAGGGAENVVMNLHERYLELGIDSWVAVGSKRSGSERVLEFTNEAARSVWARTLEARAASWEPAGGALKALSRGLLLAAEPGRYTRMFQGIEDFDYPGTDRLLSLPPHPPDILHLHNLHGYYFDLRRLPALSATQPTLITLHDAWLLSGHCAHSFACPRWKDGCGDCPDLEMYVPIRKDATERNWRIKHEAVRTSGAWLAGPSRWLMDRVETSGLLGEGTEARVIPNGVDTRVFTPGDRVAARGELGLPADRPIILFAAQRAGNNPFKDLPTLLAALPHVAKDATAPPLFVALGADAGTVDADSAEVLTAPFERDVRRLALWYRAADVYVHPARAESFGLTIAEAMASGTPVVASRVGGIPEIVDASSGILVDVGDPRAFARAISTLLEDPHLRASLGQAAAERVIRLFTLDRQADAYLAYYSEITEARRRSSARS